MPAGLRGGGVTSEIADLISTAQAAELAGIQPGTLRDYVSRGRGPSPVVRGWYDRDAVQAWVENRPGRGSRTDLKERTNG